eukprot:s917_g9.t1
MGDHDSYFRILAAAPLFQKRIQLLRFFVNSFGIHASWALMRPGPLEHAASALVENGLTESLMFELSNLARANLTDVLGANPNLTEVLGVSGQMGELLQAGYDEARMEIGEPGVLYFIGAILFPVLLILYCAFHCLTCCAFEGASALQTDPDANTTSAGGDKKKKFLMRLFKMKFGDHEGHALESCMAQLNEHGPSLLQTGKIDGKQVKQEFEAADAKGKMKLIKATMTALVAQFGNDLSTGGLAKLGIGACGQLICGGDLSYALDASGLHHCRWQCHHRDSPDEPNRSLYVPGEFTSMAIAGQNLQEVAQVASDLGKFEAEASSEAEDDEAVEKTHLWGFMKQLDLTLSTAFSSDPLRLVKMPNNTAFAVKVAPPVFLRHSGQCVKAEDKFKPGDFVTFVGENEEMPENSMVQIVEFNKLQPWRVNVKFGSMEHLVNVGELRRPIVEPTVQGWLLSTNRSLSLKFNLSAFGYGNSSGWVIVHPDLADDVGNCLRTHSSAKLAFTAQKKPQTLMQVRKVSGISVSVIATVVLFIILYRVVSSFLRKYYDDLAKEHSTIGKALQATQELSFPMVLLKVATFKKHGKFVAFEDTLNESLWLHTIQDIDDFLTKDTFREQYKGMVEAVDTVIDQNNWDMEDTYVWLDYSSIPQRHRPSQTAAINSLTVYAAKVSAFVVVAPKVDHKDVMQCRLKDLEGVLCDEDTYKKRAWCRAEQLSHLLAQAGDNMFLAKKKKPSQSMPDILRLNDEPAWLEQSIEVFKGELTCCRRKHVGMDMCDRERLVVPMLGLWAQLCRTIRSQADGSDQPEDESETSADDKRAFADLKEIHQHLSERTGYHLRSYEMS